MRAAKGVGGSGPEVRTGGRPNSVRSWTGALTTYARWNPARAGKRRPSGFHATGARAALERRPSARAPSEGAHGTGAVCEQRPSNA